MVTALTTINIGIGCSHHSPTTELMKSSFKDHGIVLTRLQFVEYSLERIQLSLLFFTHREVIILNISNGLSD